MTATSSSAKTAIRAWTWAKPVDVARWRGGLINQTYGVRSRDGALVAVLQRLNTDLFSAVVHEDIEAVTEVLSASGLCTPRLLKTRTGGLWHTTAGSEVWRCMTAVGDTTHHTFRSAKTAGEAGALVGRFHAATRDMDHSFRHVRPDPHDTPARFHHLARVLAQPSDNPLHSSVAGHAADLQRAWNSWSPIPSPTPRVIHGDLKASNIRFEGNAAVALVDLDTLGRGPLDAELGDALRSWCNPEGEDTDQPLFDVDVLLAAMKGYAQGRADEPLRRAEIDAILPSIERIALELSARFAADAIEHRVFGWEDRFGGRTEHNLLRAIGQRRLAEQVRKVTVSARAAIADVLDV